VDAHATNRSHIGALLTSWGCRCEEAGGGAAALSDLYRAAASNDPFAVVMLDSSTLGDDLPAIVRLIACDELRCPQLIVMTPLGASLDTSRLANVRLAGSLQKPIRERQLWEEFARVLRLTPE